MANLNVKILDGNWNESEVQFVQLCLDELSEIGIPFPRNLRIGEKEVLVRNDEIKITVRKMTPDSYLFFYCSYVNGNGTTFKSAPFSAEFS